MRSSAPPAPPRGEVPVLKHTAARGVRWTALAHVARMLLHLGSTTVFAWLLRPSDFGLLGMAMVVVAFVAVFKDLGTGAAIVQREDMDRDTLSAIFWANVLFGALATAALALLAPLVAAGFGEPRLVPVLRVLAIGLLVSGPGIVPQALLQRAMRFDALARIEIAAIAGGIGVGIAAAFLGAGVWSLVLQTVVSMGLLSVLALARASFRPRASLRPRLLRPVAGFSLNLTGFQVFHWLARNADHVIIGRFLGATQLGYYALAVRLVLVPLQGVSSVVGRVMFPLFSRIQEDDARFRNAYLKVTHAVALVLFPALCGLFLVCGPLVTGLFGPRWAPAAPIIAILALVGVLQAVGATTGPIYQAKGRTDLLLRWGLFAGGATIAAYALGARWGTVGVAAAFACASLALAYHGLAIPFRLIGLRVRTLCRDLARPAAATLLMAGGVSALNAFWLESVAPIPRLLSLVAAGAVAYALATLLLNRARVREVVALVAGRA